MGCASDKSSVTKNDELAPEVQKRGQGKELNEQFKAEKGQNYGGQSQDNQGFGGNSKGGKEFMGQSQGNNKGFGNQSHGNNKGFGNQSHSGMPQGKSGGKGRQRGGEEENEE